MAANQVTVATPGPAGATGLVYEGLWVVTSVYQVRDLVRYSDNNLYVCNVQHTAASGNNPTLNSTYWTLFINADDAFQWATKAKHTVINDSVGNPAGYSALHQAAKALDWATKINGEVTSDADASLDPDGFSAKAYAIGGTGVTTTSGQGAAKQWATTTGGQVDTAEYSSKEYATGTTAPLGSAKSWASKDTSAVASSLFSAKEYASGTSATGGTAKEWAQNTSAAVDTTFSSKEYAQGTQASTGGSALNWASQTGADITGGSSGDKSSKSWAQETGSTAPTDGSAKQWATLATTPSGTAADASAKEWATGVSTHKNEGSAKEWATYTGAIVRGASSGSWSAKEWAVGTTASTGGSAKDYATYVGGGVRGETGDHSSKAWAIGGTGVTDTASKGAAKEWAVGTGRIDDQSSGDYSAKVWATGGTGVTNVSGKGSAKDWAIDVTGPVDTSEFSAKSYASIVGAQAPTDGSAKEWATTTGSAIASSEFSAKEYAQGTTATGGTSKEWAQTTGAAIDTTYSSKEYAQGAVLAAGGSAKNWAQLATTPTTTATDASAKEWATGTSTHKNDGSAKSWATITGAVVTGSEYSAKEYALGTTVAAGSAKDWAILAEDSVVDGSSGYSALHWAAKAEDSKLAAKNSAAAIANSFDSFDDTYLGTMTDAVAFTAVYGTDVITSTAHGLVDTQQIQVVGTDLPAGLSASTNYFVRDKDANTFKLAATSGGTAINLTDNGTGTQTWVYGDFATPTSSSWALNSSTITVASNVGIRVGQVVSGTGIPSPSDSPPNPKPNVLSISGTSIVISQNMAAAGSSVAVTFANKGVYGTFNTTKDGPSTDNDGDALVDGMLYFNTTDNNMMVYKTTGASWIKTSASGGVSLVMHKAVASGTPTSFAASDFTPTLSYEVNNIVVWLNGVKLDATDFTATTGTTITGLSALANLDEMVVLAFKTFEVGDAVSAASGGTFGGAVTFAAGLVANTADINGGTFDGIVGGTTAAAGSFTTIGASGAITGALTGNASTATALATARTIGMTGDVVWTSPTFDGSGNVTATATIQANSVTMGTDTTGNYVATVTAGTGLTSTGATSGESIAHSLSVDAAQTQITSVGTLTNFRSTGIDDNANALAITIDSSENVIIAGGELQNSSGEFTISNTASGQNISLRTYDNIERLKIHSGGNVEIKTGGNFIVNDNIETSTTGKIKQKGAFMQSSTHQALTLGY